MSALSEPPELSTDVGPTTDRPEHGEIAGVDVVLSRVAYWREGPLHVFRSLEYDVIAADESKDDAVRMFVENSEEYAKFLADASGDPTLEDLQLASLILQRLLHSYENAAANRQVRVLRILRSRGHDARRGWHHQPEART